MPATFRVSKQFAIHEMGKALVATVLRQTREAEGLKPRLERVERVSIVPRGRCASLPCHPWECTMLGGDQFAAFGAEEVVLGEGAPLQYSSSGGHDINVFGTSCSCVGKVE